MQPLELAIIHTFAAAFATGRHGLTRDQIAPFFRRYQADMAPPIGPMTKPEHFAACVHALSPGNQRIALIELCDSPPATKHPMPDASERHELRSLIAGGRTRAPVGDALTALSVPGVRENWFRASSRLSGNPAAAVTAARTLLEATCKTIVAEHGLTPDDSGELGKLLKQTVNALGIYAASPHRQAEYNILSGLTTAVSGVANISNTAGDRHGKVGAPLDDLPLAQLVVHACGVVALYLAEKHILRLATTTSRAS